MKTARHAIFALAAFATASVACAQFSTRIPIRDPLVVDRTYYVRADGNDTNSGLINDAAGAFLTIQRAVDVVCDDLDNAGFNVVIQVADGTYTGRVSPRSYVGRGMVTIRGNTASPANVTLSSTSGILIDISAVNAGKPWVLEGFTLTTSGSGTHCIQITSGQLSVNALRFGPCVGIHVSAHRDAFVWAIGNYSITGGAAIHLNVDQGGCISIDGRTISLSGTPAFTTFANAQRSGGITAGGTVFSGGATGTRYFAQQNGTIFVNGGGANFFPGTTAGSTLTGGQYQ
jgi:hypothetical protein